MPATKPAKKRALRVEDIDRLRVVSNPRLSPDGRQIVFALRTHGEKNDTRTDLWQIAARGGEPRPLTRAGTDSRPAWSPDGRTLAFVRRVDAGTQIALLPVDGGEARLLTSFPEGDVGAFQWTSDGTRLVTSFRPRAAEWTAPQIDARKDDGRSDPPLVIDDPLYRYDGDGYFEAQRYALYEVDASSGAARLVYDKERGHAFDFDVAPDGRRAALITNRHRTAFVKEHTREVVVLDLKTKKVSRVPGAPAGSKSKVRWSPDGKLLAWAGIEDADDTRLNANVDLWVAAPGRGKAKNLTAGSDHCLLAITIADTSEVGFEATFCWGARSDRIFFQAGWHGETQIHSVPAGGGPLQTHTSGRSQHNLADLARDGKSGVLIVESATRPAELALATIAGSKKRFGVRRLTDFNGPLLDEVALADISAKWVRSTDGARVQMFTMLPPGASAKTKRPTLLNVHGGPACQYGFAFFFEFQVMAANGYAVVFSNPRGGKGYGEAHCRAIDGDWGNKDWDDIQAVADDAAAQSFCDPKRFAICGGSYGGYMTLWAIGHTRRFTAAVADRCVANMVSMWGASDIYVWPDTFFPGNAWDDTEKLWDMSPLKHLGNARTPTLIVHSEGDLRCNVAESEQAYSSLVIQGVPTRFVRYPRSTSHGMSRGGPPDMRKHRLEQYLAWWDRWLRKPSRPART